MIQTIARQRGPHARQPLARAHLLASASRVLDEARRIEHRALALTTRPDARDIIAGLAHQREVLARRAANVALGSVVSAEELRELRAAATELVAVTGWVTRKLNFTRMS